MGIYIDNKTQIPQVFTVLDPGQKKSPVIAAPFIPVFQLQLLVTKGKAYISNQSEFVL